MTSPSVNRIFTFSRDIIASRDNWALEASAGTGKTWTIENFVAHYLASGLRTDEVVVVTFTRMAAGELRGRIRSNIAAIVTAMNGDYDEHERNALRSSLADFSQMRITTIHGFAQRCLAMLGEPMGELNADVDADHFRSSVVSDVLRALPDDLTRRYGEGKERLRVEEALRALAANPGGDVRVSAPGDDTGELLEVVARVRAGVAKRKKELHVAGFDDLLTRLARRLDNTDDARTVAGTIKVLLVDEFQDTDGLQWEIFQKIRGAGDLASFVVVGDPKQAIYGFRGGDVQVYREAVSSEEAHLLIGNRRSTSNFVEASNHFFADSSFGISFNHADVGDDFVVRDVDIPYVPVTAAGPLRDVTEGPSWTFRHVNATAAASIREEAARDLPGYVRSVVGRETIPNATAAGVVERPVRYDDFCVLVVSNRYAVQLLRELDRHGVPATVIGGANVFASAAAVQWRYLLGALQSPASGDSARLLALSWFGGSSLSDVARRRDDEGWLALHQQLLLRWYDLFSSVDRHDFFDTVIEESRVLEFLVDQPSAERHITDVQHLAELLRTRSRDSLDQLVDFLTDASTTVDGDESSDVDGVGRQWARRVDGDDEAVRIMTVHKAKGLQFPIVLLPFMNSYSQSRASVATYRAYRDGVGTTVVDLTATAKAPGAAVKSALAAAEHLRKAYVALTRAQVRNVLWTWDDSSTAAYRPVVRSTSERRQLAAQHPEYFSFVEASSTDAAPPPATPSPVSAPRELAISTRQLRAPRRRLSFSALSEHITGTSTPTGATRDLEPVGPDGDLEEMADLDDDEFVALRSSAQIGRVVHRVLQYADVARPDRRTALSEQLIAAAQFEGLILDDASATPVSSEALLTLVERGLDTSLGAIAQDRTLGSFAGSLRLPEMGFEFVLSDDSSATWASVAALLRLHLGEEARYRTWLDGLDFEPVDLRGMMTGSLDAVLAWEEDDAPRFLVVDYKTNLVTNADGLEHYGPSSLWTAMSQHHYQLQAILYLVALHRYLRGRLGDYDYDTHVAGAAYLFLRGMSPGEPGSGVVTVTPPATLIKDLSDLFDGRLQ